MIVLGIDAVWTPTQPSGVALVKRDPSGRWRAMAAAPSYAAFLAMAAGEQVDWEGPVDQTEVSFPHVLNAAQALSGGRPTVIAVDMPVSTQPIEARRPADSEISRTFGSAGCSTHSPSTSRPGIIGSLLSRACDDAGYPIAGTDTPRGTQNRLLEVYPHPALLALLDVDYRFPYKVSKARKLWPKSDAEGRKSAVLDSFARILAALRERIDGIDIDLPELSRVGSLSGLKRYEDALDVLVCCWVGMEYLDGRAEAFGDEDAAIWVPADARLRVQKNRNSLLNGRSSE